MEVAAVAAIFHETLHSLLNLIVITEYTKNRLQVVEVTETWCPNLAILVSAKFFPFCIQHPRVSY